MHIAHAVLLHSGSRLQYSLKTQVRYFIWRYTFSVLIVKIWYQIYLWHIYAGQHFTLIHTQALGFSWAKNYPQNYLRIIKSLRNYVSLCFHNTYIWIQVLCITIWSGNLAIECNLVSTIRFKIEKRFCI